ncbi:ADP-glyceromanno-heptose 6-epimerase [Candidatus Saganbacteria bacterium]|nr:ADP-glyceromanno-heptose 6-epimerase [Candidatus Saganbacteria bacterium]
MIILTGGAGFIGNCFLWKLNSEGETDILVVDHINSPLKKKNLSNKKFTDYIEKDEFIKLVESGKFKLDSKSAIFHIGACSSTTEINLDYLMSNNFEYSKTLAKLAFDNNIPFHYASSAATYGDGSLGYSDDDDLTLKLKPLNLYGYSKHIFDIWLIKNKLVGKVVGYRYFNVFGPNEYHKEDMRSLIVKAYEQIKRDSKIRLFKSYRPDYKDGEQKRDFVYVKDVVNIMYEFYRKRNVSGIYNIGTGKARTWNDLASAIFAALKMPVNIEYIEMPENIRDKYQYFTQADLSKLKKSGITSRFTPLEDSVSDYVNNYLEKSFAIL